MGGAGSLRGVSVTEVSLKNIYLNLVDIYVKFRIGKLAAIKMVYLFRGQGISVSAPSKLI